MDRAAYAGMNAVENHHWWFVARRQILASLIERTVRPAPDARVLEAGCGTGGNLSLLARFGQLEAFEYDAEARALAAEKNVCVIKAGALPDGIDTSGAPYDMVAILDVLEHIDDDVASLASLRAVTRKDGRIVLTVPALPALWSSHDELHHHKRRYTKASLQRALVDAGWDIEQSGYFNSLLFPVALLQRLWAKLRGKAEPVDALPAPALNAALRMVFAAERHLIARLPLPIGLSLFAIARRAD
ncbi:MAG: class I SAM-dependent methyltransferase [Sphingopyxis sp.]|jgi:SAM-dependent methyltransferase|nr:class I SAM-dependent methyltransferase [Sphingopyxis sp.]